MARALVSKGMRWLLFALALAACESPGRQVTDAGDPVDAGYPDSTWDERAVPFTLAGTTPIGTLDFVRYRSASYLSGFCQSGVYLELRESPAFFSDHPELRITLLLDPFATPAPTGRVMGRAELVSSSHSTDPDAITDQVALDLSRAEIVSTQPNTLAVAGRLSIASDGWSFDFMIDEMLEQVVCI